MEMLDKIAVTLQLLKTKRPLVHHITNYVTVNDCANVTLAIGGSPVMADDPAEVAEMTALASSLVLNIGTLNARTVESMMIAGNSANDHAIPIVFDPVGIGATKLRSLTAEKIVRELRPSVIRGNMSEIKRLAGMDVSIQGVDSTADALGAEVTARQLAKELKCVVAITGKRDIITDGVRTCLIDNGHAMMASVTGTGCMATSLTASFCAVTSDYVMGATAGIMAMGLSGERAFQSLAQAEGIGTFRVRMLDQVYRLTPEVFRKEGKIIVE